MNENDPYRRDQYKRITKQALVTMLLSTQDREVAALRRYDASEEQRHSLVNQRTLDESKIHQLQTALDGAVRARTQALEEVQQLRQRSWREDTKGEVGQANLKDLREAMALLTKVIK